MTRKAVLATFGSGPAGALLKVAFPTFQRFAARHGYELVVGTGESYGRPTSWGKVPFIRRLLDSYDVVLWLDADCVIINDSEDPDRVTPPDAYQALVETPLWDEQAVPCCGVWLLRSGERSKAFLDLVWEQTQYVDHRYWEQTAVVELLGYSTEPPFRLVEPTKWRVGTHWLPEQWDMLPSLPIGLAPGYIRHYAGMPNKDRLRYMRADAAASTGRLPGLLANALLAYRFVDFQARHRRHRAFRYLRRWARSVTGRVKPFIADPP